MRIINVIVKVLTFPAAFLKGFWEQRFCRMMGIPVESKKIFGSGEMAGHIEHEPIRSPKKSFWFCFLSGFMVFLTGLVIAAPALFGWLYLDVASPLMKYLVISWLGLSFNMFANIFPSVEDALMMWEKYKEMGKGARIILAPAAAIMYAGAYAESWGITFLINHVWIVLALVSILS